MTWLWSILADFALNKLWGAFREWQAKRRGKAEAKQEAMEDEKRRVEKGRDAVRDGRDHDPDDRLRRNDGQW